MSQLVFVHDRAGYTGPLSVTVRSEASHGALGAAGLGPANYPQEWELEANGNLPSTAQIAGVAPGAGPMPPLHRLTVYQNARPISSVTFYPIETAPGIVSVLSLLKAGQAQVAAPEQLVALSTMLDDGTMKLAEMDQALVDSAQSQALVVAAAGLIPAQTYAVIPAQDGYYRVMTGPEAGQVYRRQGGTLTRQPTLEALSSTALRSNGFVSVLDPEFGVKGDGVTDDSAAIQAVLNAHKRVVFPSRTYVATSLKPQQGSILEFQDVTLKFPTGVANYLAMIYLGDVSATSLMGPYTVRGRLTVDATGQAGSKLLKGIYVIGARDFDVEGVHALNLQGGFALHIAKSYGANGLNKIVPQDGTFRRISSLNSPWGAVAITAGRSIDGSGIVADTGTGAAVVIETDVSVGDEARNITLRNLTGRNGCNALNLVAHEYVIDGVTAEGLRVESPNAASSVLVNLSQTVGQGRLGQITLRDGQLDGGLSGIYSPNAVTAEALVVENFQVRNCADNGYRVNGGTWRNSSAVNCAKNGWQSAGTPPAGTIARFEKCVATDNNAANTSNTSGWSYSGHAELVLADCEATDTRGTKLQRYAVFADGSAVSLSRVKFAGNLSGRFNVVNGGSVAERDNRDGLTTVSAFRVWAPAAQAFNAGVNTKVLFSNLDYDNLSEFDRTANSRFVAKAAGVYVFKAGVTFPAPATGTRFVMDLFVNGVFKERLSDVTVNGTPTYGGPYATALLQLSAGDYVEWQVNSSTALSTFAGRGYVYCEGARVG